MKRRLTLSAAALLIAVSACSNEATPSKAAPPVAAPAPAPPPAPTLPPVPSDPPQELKTARGSVKAPGEAFLNGFNEKTRVTAPRIDVWSTWMSNGEKVCTGSHGERVVVSQWKNNPYDLRPEDEKAKTGNGVRYWFHVSTPTCSGWVSESFVTRTR